MRIAESLAAWLAAPAKQAASGAGQRALAEVSDEIAAIRAKLDALAEAPIGAIMAQVVEALDDTGWVERIIDRAVTTLARDPMVEPPFGAIIDSRQRGLVLLDHPLVVIVATLTFADTLVAAPARIGLSGACGVLRIVRGGGARLGFWRLGYDGLLRRAGDAEARDGMILTIDGSREAVTIERADADILTLRAQLRRDLRPVSRAYCAASGALVSQASTRPEESRARMMLALLRLTRRNDGGACFVAAIDAPSADLRWAAAREWLALDRAQALPHIRRLALSDPDPDVRAVAGRTLDRVAA